MVAARSDLEAAALARARDRFPGLARAVRRRGTGGPRATYDVLARNSRTREVDVVIGTVSVPRAAS